MQSNNRSYLVFSNLWRQKEEQLQHKRRMNVINKPRTNSQSSYYNQKDQIYYQNIKQSQLLSSRRKELNKWQNIQQQNHQILQRLTKITQRLPSPLNRTPSPLSNPGSPRSTSHIKKEKREKIFVENQRIKSKLITMESSLKGQRFQKDYQQHQKYKEKLQKYLKGDTTSKSKLRALKLLENVYKQKSLLVTKINNQPRALSDFQHKSPSASQKYYNHSVSQRDSLEEKQNYMPKIQQSNNVRNQKDNRGASYHSYVVKFSDPKENKYFLNFKHKTTQKSPNKKGGQNYHSQPL